MRPLRTIANKIIAGTHNPEDGVLLFEKADTALCDALASLYAVPFMYKTYFNRNFHIEPTNVCVFACKFCSIHASMPIAKKG